MCKKRCVSYYVIDVHPPIPHLSNNRTHVQWASNEYTGQTSQVCVNLFLRANNSGFCIYTHCTPTMLHNNKSINYDVIDSDQPFSMRSRVDTNYYTFWSCPQTSAHVWTYHCQKQFTYCTAILRHHSNGSSCKIHLVSDTRRDPCNSKSSHDAYL